MAASASTALSLCLLKPFCRTSLSSFEPHASRGGLPSPSSYPVHAKWFCNKHQTSQCSESGLAVSQHGGKWLIMNRRDVLRLTIGVSNILLVPFSVEAAGLALEEKPKLCDDACEKELENVPMVTTESGLQYKDIKVGGGPSPPIGFQVAANYVAMVPSGQIFDR